MSEIYLTKIERKTIFTKSLIFVLIMFIISDLTVTGPFYFNFIPWLYILGLIGSIKKIDSILMSVIGSFTVFVACVIMQGGFNLVCVISTLITLVELVLGIITGKLAFEFILEHRLVKYIKPSKKTIYIISMILMFITAVVTVGLYSGNILTFLKSKNNLDNYITTKYGIQNFEIEQVKYSRKVPGKYVYTVDIEGAEVYFVPVSKEVFKDANMSERLEVLNNKLEEETSSKVQEVKNKYSLLMQAEITYNLEYSKLGITPDAVVMYIECVQQDEESMDKLYEQIVQFIKEVENVKTMDKIVININDGSLEIYYDEIEELTKEYIQGGFEVEEISQYL